MRKRICLGGPCDGLEIDDDLGPIIYFARLHGMTYVGKDVMPQPPSEGLDRYELKQNVDGQWRYIWMGVLP